MVIKTFTRLVGLLLCVFGLHLLGTQKAVASHAMGADLSYECVDPVTRQYKIILRFYRDCEGISEPTSVTLDVSSFTCGQDLTITLSKDSCTGNNCEVSPLCPTSLSQSSCNGGSLPGVEAFTYSAIITLPEECPDWIFAFDECCRNDLITNLVSASSEDLYIEATLNNAFQSGSCNNSPVFTTLPVPYICANQPFSYNQGAVDVDGDSLVYSLVTPLSSGGTLVTYASGYSPTNPLTTTPPNTFNFSPTLGQISFTPNGVQVAVVTVLVKEYRNGVLIGSTMRDIQVVILNIPGCGVPPVFSGVDSASVSNGFYLSPQFVQVCPGNALSLSMFASNPSGDSLFLESNAAVAIPGAQLNIQYVSSDSVFGHLTWTPTGLDTGINNIILTVKNKNCPVSNVQSYAVTIQVLAGTYAGPDLFYCPAGGPVQLQAYGGTQFTWSPVQGLDNIIIANPKAQPTVTTDYIVTSNLSNSCKNKDTVRVNVVPDFNYNLAQSDDTICRFQTVDLSIVADSAYAPYRYQWAPANRVSSATIPNPTTKPDNTTTYRITVTSQLGCVVKDSLQVVVEGQAPLVAISADKYKACDGDTIQIKADISLLPCGLNAMSCDGSYSIKNLGTATGSAPRVNSRLVTPYGGYWMDGRLQMLYRASELKAIGMQRGTITDLAFNIISVRSNKPYVGYTIRMGCTNLNDLSTYVPNLVPVYGPYDYTPTGPGYNTHTFDTPYDWDGESNLVVEICFDNDEYSAFDSVYCTPTTYNSVVYYQADFEIGCDINTVNLSTYRPNTQFIYCADDAKTITYTWNPTNDLYTPDTVNPFVILYKSTEYQLNVSDGNCVGSASVKLDIDTTFTINAGDDTSYCLGDTLRLNATGIGDLPVGGIINCGVRGAPCGGTPVVQTFIPASPFATSQTPFAGDVVSSPEDQRSQMLYLASDLLAAGFTPGTISKVGFNIVNKGSPFPFQNFTVKMGCSQKTTLTDQSWEPTVQVFTATTFNTISGWNDVTLQNTFNWDGVSNIVIEICWNNLDNFFSAVADQIQSGTVGYRGFHTVTSKLAVGCNLTATNSVAYTTVPSLRVTMCDPPPLPITYNWTPEAGLTYPDSANPIAAPQQTTTYYVTALFGGKCPRTDSVVVTPKNILYTISADTSTCSGFPVQLFVEGSGIVGATNFVYQWNEDTTLSCLNCPNPVALSQDTVTYHVYINDTITGCDANDSVTVNVFNLTAEPWFTDTLADQGKEVVLGVNVTGGNGSLSYAWSPDTYLNRTDSATVIATPLFDSVLYTISVTSGPCVDTSQIFVRVNILESPVKMPTAFTPNGDGHNDVFYPVFSNDKLATVKTFNIYNRYGALIHSGTGPWDGRFKGQMQPAGTFVYYIVIQRPFKDDESIQGSFTLLH